jgi:hypothetical protein
MGLPNHFFSDSWVVGFLEGLIIAERRITETSFAVGFKPFLDRLGRKAGATMCPLYVSGLIRN